MVTSVEKGLQSKRGTTVTAAPAAMKAGTMLKVGRAMPRVILNLGEITAGDLTPGVRSLGLPGRVKRNRTLGLARELKRPGKVNRLPPPDRKEDGDLKIGINQLGALISV